MKVKCFFKVNYGPFTGKQMIPQVYFMARQRVAVFWQKIGFFFKLFRMGEASWLKWIIKCFSTDYSIVVFMFPLTSMRHWLKL